MKQNNLEIIVLAAGQGSRMQSNLPKVLHKIAGFSMLQQVIQRAKLLNPTKIHIVIGHKGEEIIQAFSHETNINWVWQKEQKGTGHALMQVEPHLSDSSKVLVLYGDVPLLNVANLAELCNLIDANNLALLTAFLDNPTGYGRIVREKQAVVRIVEQKDAKAEELTIKEINTGILALTTSMLKKYLPMLSNDNAQKEYYLTDVISLAKQDGLNIQTTHPDFTWQIMGVNSRTQLLELEKIWQAELAQKLLQNGVSLADDRSLSIRGDIKHGKDIFIDVGCVFIGNVVLEDEISIGAYCVIKDCVIGKGTQIQAFSHLDGAQIGENANIGPYARLRPGAKLQEKVKVGNFVEIKASEVEEGAKVNHLAYIGDAQIGANANIGAGVITCNYDGANKHKTKVGKNAFVGSNVSLVAPVEVGENATVGAGTILRKNLADASLGVSIGKYVEKDNWQRPTKKDKNN